MRDPRSLVKESEACQYVTSCHVGDQPMLLGWQARVRNATWEDIIIAKQFMNIYTMHPLEKKTKTGAFLGDSKPNSTVVDW